MGEVLVGLVREWASTELVSSSAESGGWRGEGGSGREARTCSGRERRTGNRGRKGGRGQLLFVPGRTGGRGSVGEGGSRGWVGRRVEGDPARDFGDGVVRGGGAVADKVGLGCRC